MKHDKHINGPWVPHHSLYDYYDVPPTVGAKIFDVMDRDGNAVADVEVVSSGTDELTSARIRLIAAAPELLEVVVDLIEAFGTNAPQWEAARSVVAKAQTRGPKTWAPKVWGSKS